jgi:hypothetical protein
MITLSKSKNNLWFLIKIMMRKCLFGKVTFDLVFPDKGIIENNDA